MTTETHSNLPLLLIFIIGLAAVGLFIFIIEQSLTEEFTRSSERLESALLNTMAIYNDTPEAKMIKKFVLVRDREKNILNRRVDMFDVIELHKILISKELADLKTKIKNLEATSQKGAHCK